MNCEQVKPALVEYLLEESSAEERQEMDGHLQSCESCSQEMAELKQTMALLARGEASEEVPRRIRIVAEPISRWWAFWRNPAQLAFGGAGLLCLAIALLALFGTSISYQNGNFQIAFGAPAVSSGAQFSSTMPAAATAQPLDRAQVLQMIAEARVADEAEQQRRSGLMAKEVAQQMQEQWQHDLQEMAGSLRYFQSAQTVLWKEQVQNQQLVSTLMQHAGLTTPAQP